MAKPNTSTAGKTKRPEIDIYKSIRRNNLIVWGLFALFLINIFVNSSVLIKIYNLQMSKVLTFDKTGEVIPLQWVDREENIRIEIKNHLETFHRYFYQYDAYNYKERIEGHALWLADKSVEDLYVDRVNDLWFDKVRQFQIDQSLFINPEDITVTGNKEPYSFRVAATLIIEQGGKRNAYKFETTGNILLVGRNYPLNAHGLLITNFIEDTREIIQE